MASHIKITEVSKPLSYRDKIYITNQKGRLLKCALNCLNAALTYSEINENQRKYAHLVDLWNTKHLQQCLEEVFDNFCSFLEGLKDELFWGSLPETAFDSALEVNAKYKTFIDSLNQFILFAFNKYQEDPKIIPGKSGVLQIAVTIQTLLDFSGFNLEEMDHERLENIRFVIPANNLQGSGRRTEATIVTAADLIEDGEPKREILRKLRQRLINTLNAIGVDIERKNKPDNTEMTYYWYMSRVIFGSIEAFCRDPASIMKSLEPEALNRDYFDLCDRVTGYPRRRPNKN